MQVSLNIVDTCSTQSAFKNKNLIIDSECSGAFAILNQQQIVPAQNVNNRHYLIEKPEGIVTIMY